MARRDKIHEAVKQALINDGWTITADPYWIKYKTLQLPADLGAERPIAAERGTEKIVVEIKSFLSTSLIHELQAALGQYQVYQSLLRMSGDARLLYLAVSLSVWEQFFLIEAVADLIAESNVRIIVVDLRSEEITLWKT